MFDDTTNPQLKWLIGIPPIMINVPHICNNEGKAGIPNKLYHNPYITMKEIIGHFSNVLYITMKEMSRHFP